MRVDLHPRRWNLRQRLIALGAGSAVLTAAVLVGVGAWQTTRFTDQAGARVDDLTASDLAHVTSNIDRLVTAVGTSVQDAQNHSMVVADAAIHDAGGMRLAKETTTWQAKNQVTGAITSVRLPKVTIGGTWLGHNADPRVPTPVVDRIKQIVDGSVTVFQRMDEQGDLLRVATNVPTADGGRAIGTYIPAVNDDGTPNAVAAAIKAGKPYRGIAKVVDTWNVAAYDPVRDGSGKIIGAAFVGVPQAEAIAALSDALAGTSVGQHGSVSIVSTAATDRGRVVASTDKAKVGTTLQGNDAAGTPWVERTLDRAAELAPGASASAHYRLPGSGGAPVADSTVHVASYPAYNWATVVSAYGPDYSAARTALADGRRTMLQVFVAAAVLLALAGAMVAGLIAGRMSRRMGRLTDAMSALAERDITVSVPEDGDDEIGTMSRALNRAVGQLHELLTAITDEAGRVDVAADRIGGMGQDLTASADAATTLSSAAANAAGEVSANVQTLSASSEQMTASISEISGSAHEAAAVARDGVRLAGEVESVMRTLSDSSGRIAEMIGVITTIAEQTNMLALNATIEAARAGESGRGFAVVANEVKDLAGQTARATEEVTARVTTIKNDTASAFDAITAITQTIGRVDDYQTAIAAAVEEQTATTNDMARNVSAAAQGSGRIFDRLGEVEATMEKTRLAVDGSARATAELEQTVSRLSELVGGFRV